MAPAASANIATSSSHLQRRGALRNHGAPLLRSVPFIAAPGNHDTDLNNFQRYPDALAYFLYWDQPLNGPVAPADAESHAHVLPAAMAHSRNF